MTIIQISDYGFISDPFPLIPRAKVTNWAGMAEIKQLLLDVVESVLTTDVGLSEFIIIHGDYGAGKSHALRYFTTLINDIQKEHYRSKAVYIKTLRLAQKVTFLGVFREVIETMGFAFLSELGSKIKGSLDVAGEKLKESLDKEELIQLIQTNMFSTRVLEENVLEEERPMAQLLMKIANGDTDAKKFLLCEKKILPDIGYPNPIDSEFMATKVLGNLFRTMALPISGQEPPCRGAYLFIDEIESILEVKAVEQQMLFQSFRELVDELPYNFCMIWSFSGDAALLEAVIPLPLMRRLSRRYIELQSMEIDEAKDFIRSQFAQFRPVGFEPDNPYHPFREDTIESIFEHIVEMIPRQIFRNLRIVLERAIRRYGLQPGEEIEPALAEIILGESGL